MSSKSDVENSFAGLSRRAFIKAAGLAAATAPIALRSRHAFAADGAAADRTVTIGLNADLPTMDPQASWSIQGFTAWHHVFDGLTSQDADSHLGPALAESWQLVSPTQWRFKLRQGVTFHDGQKFTAEAVKFTLERIADPKTKSPQSFLWSTLAGVDAVDDHTVDIRLKQPNAALLRNLSITAILPPNADRVPQFFDKPVGTGPFKITAWSRGASLTATAFPGYWGTKPQVRDVVFRILPAASTRKAAIQSGEVDITFSLPPEQIVLLKRSPDLMVLTRTMNQSQIIQFNLKRAPFNDRRVRLALNYGTNKDVLLKELEFNYAKIMTAPMPPAVEDFDAGLRPYRYDPDKARKLLAEAGVHDLTFELNGFRGFSATGLSEEQAIADQWRQLGIKVTVNDIEFGRLIAQRAAGNYDAIYTVWSVLTADPDFALARNFQKGNVFGYDNADVQKLLNDGNAAMEAAKRSDIYHRAQQMIWNDCPWVWLWYPDLVVIARRRVRNFHARADGLISVRDVAVAA